MSTVTVTKNFKITLPKEIRESMHLQPGQVFELIQNGSGIQLVPKRPKVPEPICCSNQL